MIPVKIEPYIHKAKERLQQVEKEIAEFDFSSVDSERGAYEKINREYQRLRDLLQSWQDLQQYQRQLQDNHELLDQEEEPEMIEVIKADIESLTEDLAVAERRLKTLILPPDDNDQRNSIIEIRPAAGGDEAGLFAYDLFRMYTRYAESKSWQMQVLDLIENDVGGLKAVVFSLQGQQVHRYMNFESGVHRVQRVPQTETAGRIHTSTVTVAVLPEAQEVDMQLKNEELRIDVFRSSGPGGQSVNTTDSAVRVTHLPSGISVASQKEKSQHRNKEIAMLLLRSRLLDAKQAEEAAKNAAQRRSQVGTGDRSERIRTYNFPQSRVTDHRYGITRHDLTSLLAGQLDDFLDEIIALDVEKRLTEEIVNS